MNSKEAKVYASELMKNRNYCEMARTTIMRTIELEFELCDDMPMSKLKELIIGANHGKNENQNYKKSSESERHLKVVQC